MIAVRGVERVRNVAQRRGIALAVLASAMLFPGSASAQWSGSNPITTSSNVGIGTSSPGEALTVLSASASPFSIGDAGYGDYILYYGFGYNDLDAYGAALRFYSSTYGIQFRTGGADPAVTILNNGSVGIGTASPQHLLHVAGTIGAEEVIVSSTGADYVFDPGYRLQPLSEVADYVKENHHLPEIPSAAEVKESGVSLGEMQSKLLAKIEELTLHMIQSEERNNRLEQQNRDLQERIGRLESHDAKAEVAVDHLAR